MSMKRPGYVGQVAGRKHSQSRPSVDGDISDSCRDTLPNVPHRPRKALLNRPSPDNGHTQRDSRKHRTLGRSGAQQPSLMGRGDNAISKYSDALADPSRRSLANPLAGIDPVLAAAAAAAVMNAGLLPQSGSNPFANLNFGGNSSNSAAAVAAVAAAAMNAAAMAAAMGVNNTSSGKQTSQSKKPFSLQRPSSSRRSFESSSFSGPRPKRPANNNRNSHDAPAAPDWERDGSPNQGRFPHHLDHRNPEDDPTATRTLFVGNLMPDITEDDLRSLFERYGFIEDIDIKRRDPGSGINAFAFIRYVNLDMAHRAKVDMSGQLIGQFTCKIGYGKVVPTRCLWIGGLGPWITYPEFANLLEEFGPTEKIIWPSGKNYAHVLFPNVELAIAAADALRGYPLGGVARRIRVDFTDEAHMIRDPLKRRRLGNSASAADFDFSGHRGSFNSRVDREHNPGRFFERGRGKRDYTSGSDELRDNSSISLPKNDSFKKNFRPGRELLTAKRRNPPTTPSDDEVCDSEQSVNFKPQNSPRVPHLDRLPLPPKPLTPQNATNIEQLASCLPTAWDGVFFLKSSSFPCRMHILRGDKGLVDQFMSSRAQSFFQRDSGLAHQGKSVPTSPVVSTSGDAKSMAESDVSVSLRITQRMKLDPIKLDDVSQRINAAGNSGFCVLLAVPSPGSTLTDSTDATKQPQRPLRNLISYLRTKDSAGVVLLNPLCASQGSSDPQSVTGVLHAFPPCDFAFELLKERAVSLQKEYTRDDHLVVLLIRSTGTL